MGGPADCRTSTPGPRSAAARPAGGRFRPPAAIGGPGVDVSALAPAHLHPDGCSNTNAGSA
ncbi:putative uncharacterized protein [Xanthomonas citri pv. punicae str. LMG 859]|nr:putative uncharacterized protein [Xanthomonas citri pv. punicae str. LMG 859]